MRSCPYIHPIAAPATNFPLLCSPTVLHTGKTLLLNHNMALLKVQEKEEKSEKPPPRRLRPAFCKKLFLPS